ncbi:MAG: hypothetical protein IJ167_06295 [Lachnospiraceae bacterium]|nr:hypothetical protein [Lachnospiraceae bacterium]
MDESDGLKESDDYEIEESNDFAFEESDDYGLEDSDDEVVSHIKIAFKINDSVSDTLNDMTFYLEEDEYVFLKLYNDNVFKMALVAYKEKDKNLIYSGVNYDGYDDEEIMDIIKELKEGLE